MLINSKNKIITEKSIDETFRYINGTITRYFKLFSSLTPISETILKQVDYDVYETYRDLSETLENVVNYTTFATKLVSINETGKSGNFTPISNVEFKLHVLYNIYNILNTVTIRLKTFIDNNRDPRGYINKRINLDDLAALTRNIKEYTDNAVDLKG